MVYYRLFSFIIRYTIVSDFKLLDQSQVAECTIWIGKTVEKLVPTMPPSSMAFLAAVGPTFKKKTKVHMRRRCSKQYQRYLQDQRLITRSQMNILRNNNWLMVSTHLNNIIVKMGTFPQIGVNIKNVWNHDLDSIFDKDLLKQHGSPEGFLNIFITISNTSSWIFKKDLAWIPGLKLAWNWREGGTQFWN